MLHCAACTDRTVVIALFSTADTPNRILKSQNHDDSLVGAGLREDSVLHTHVR